MNDMESKKRGLGRGLSALMPSGPSAPSAERAAHSAQAPQIAETKRGPLMVGVELIAPSPEQPRRRFGEAELVQLADSIRHHGIILPLIVRPRPQGGYFLIAGERRWRAAQRAGVTTVPVVVQDVSSKEAFERAIVENVQRADLGPLEEAAAYQRLMSEFGLTQEAVAERVSKDRATVANTLRLLKLPSGVRQLVDEGRLSMGHARALLGLASLTEGSEAAMETAARRVVSEQLSVRATESLVKKSLAPVSKAVPTPVPKRPELRDLEERLLRALGSRVQIHETTPGKSGRIEIPYQDLDHLDRLLRKLL